MRKITYILLTTLLLACKSESGIELSDNSNNVVECPKDSILLKKITSDNLLFNKTYVLIDTIYKSLDFRLDTSHQDQTIVELIKNDSIPNKIYTTCRYRKNQNWNDYKSIDLIENQRLEKIFEDPYIVSGKIDNYKVLKQTTGKDGFMYVSDFYYSGDFQYVLVGIKVYCGWLCGEHQLRMYTKKNGKWYLEMNYVTIES